MTYQTVKAVYRLIVANYDILLVKFINIGTMYVNRYYRNKPSKSENDVVGYLSFD